MEHGLGPEALNMCRRGRGMWAPLKKITGAVHHHRRDGWVCYPPSERGRPVFVEGFNA